MPEGFDAYEPTLEHAVQECRRFVAEMEGGFPIGRWLTLSGKAGCGKTMLARQVLQRSKQSNPGRSGPWVRQEPSGPYRGPRPECVWIDATDFAQRLRDGEYDLPESYRYDWCVIFDDMGTARDKSDFIAEAIFRFCASRLGRWTMFTTNLALSEISDGIDERVSSRLIRDGNTMIRIDSGDYALKTHRRNKRAAS